MCKYRMYDLKLLSQPNMLHLYFRNHRYSPTSPYYSVLKNINYHARVLLPPTTPPREE